MKKRLLISLSFFTIGLLVYFVFNINLLSKNYLLFELIRNYVPDICWTFSFFFASINFLEKIIKKTIIVNSIYVISIAVIYELLQYFNIVNGTFDTIDISIYLFSTIIAALVELIMEEKRKCQKKLV